MAIVMPLTRFWMGAASRSGELLYLIDELDCSYGSCERCLLLSRGYSRSTGNRKELACTLINIFIMHSNEFLIGDNLVIYSSNPRSSSPFSAKTLTLSKRRATSSASRLSRTSTTSFQILTLLNRMVSVSKSCFGSVKSC